MAKVKQKDPTSAECMAELRMWIPLSVVAICKLIAQETGQSSGNMLCPACRTGTLRWSVAASNGHARVLCDRKCADGTNCISAME